MSVIDPTGLTTEYELLDTATPGAYLASRLEVRPPHHRLVLIRSGTGVHHHIRGEHARWVHRWTTPLSTSTRSSIAAIASSTRSIRARRSCSCSTCRS